MLPDMAKLDFADMIKDFKNAQVSLGVRVGPKCTHMYPCVATEVEMGDQKV